MELSGWGRWPRIKGEGCFFEDETTLRACLGLGRVMIPRGMGRSYGDSAVADQVLFTVRARRMLNFDETTGLLTCQAGVSLAEIIEAFLPRGWFLGVTPGTKYVTVGGAVASDVHGKNHHQEGCFSNFVESFELMLPDGRLVSCSRNHNAGLFRATCGGMGLTGVILKVALRLIRINSSYIREAIRPARHLVEVLDLFEAYRGEPYSVAWIDALSGGDRQGRAILMTGRHEEDGRLIRARQTRVGLPWDAPVFSLNKYTVSLFNMLYFHLTGRARYRRRHLEGFFYPLDSVDRWNRMYGRRGFIQYQFVVPKEASLTGLTEVLNLVRRAGQGSFLTVLKLLGPANDHYLSFPLEGYTLALDFKVQPSLFPLLAELDRIVLAHGGRVYLTKDARMPRAMLVAGYPHLDRFLEIRRRLGLTSRLQSQQSRRLEI